MVTALTVQSATCTDGSRVLVLEDDRLPLVAVNVRYAVGSRDDPPGRSGMAHLFEHLMFTGSANVADGEHIRTIQRLGGTCNAATGMDSTNYYELIPADAVDLALWLEADRTHSLTAALTQDSLDRQRRIVLNEMHQTVGDKPEGRMLGDVLARMFPADHAYHSPPIGSEAGITSVTLGECFDFFATKYRPENLVISVVGDVTFDQVMESYERFFQARPQMPSHPLPVPPPDAVATTPAIEAGAKPGSAGPPVVACLPGRYMQQCLGFLLPSACTAEFDFAGFAASILARGESSRLMARLVRSAGLLTDVKIRLLPLLDGPSVGIVQLLPGDGISVEQTVGLYQEAIELLRSAGPSEDEFACASALHEASIADRLETCGGLAEELTWRAIACPAGPPLLDWDAHPETRWRTAGLQAIGYWTADLARVSLCYKPEG